MSDTTWTREEPAVDQPFYGATPMAAVRRFFLKYAIFSGRASRSEYWWWTLVAVLVPVAIQVATGLATGTWRLPLPPVPATLSQLFAVAIFVPTLALTWRRLHDTNRTGLWFFFGLIPVLGWLVLLYFTVLPADPRGQRYDRQLTVPQGGLLQP